MGTGSVWRRIRTPERSKKELGILISVGAAEGTSRAEPPGGIWEIWQRSPEEKNPYTASLCMETGLFKNPRQFLPKMWIFNRILGIRQ